MSYARLDDDDYDHVVELLRKQLAGRFEATLITTGLGNRV
jgi:hypothetical protein